MIHEHFPTGGILIAVALALPAPAQDRAQDPAGSAGFQWDARAAEHLLNRAGFGARPAEIRRWVEAGQEALVDDLLAERPDSEPFFVEAPLRGLRQTRDKASKLTEPERRKLRGELRQADRQQLQAYLEWWVRHMLAADDPLRDRMTLFWAGFFTSGYQTVKSSRLMIEQNLLLRANATGSYADLLAGIVKDPAMLRYLDNGSNNKAKPNENLARELMELFSLGEGNYSERDVLEAARALTGHGVLPVGDYRFFARRHDYGPKEILGKRGRHDAADLVAILIEQDACPRFVAGELIEYLEGVAPTPERLERYAAMLREGNYRLEPVLRALFLDPDFYREEVVGGRIASPIDFLVGSARRLGLRMPPQFVVSASALLGQRLFDPPNVKGWEEGEAWITTSSLMMRGNLMGILLGQVGLEDLDDDAELELLAQAQTEEEPSMDGRSVDLDDESMSGESMMAELESEMEISMQSGPTAPDTSPPLIGAAAQREKSELTRILRAMTRFGYRPPVNLAFRVGREGLRSDEEIVDYLTGELLAIEVPAETRAMLTLHLARERAQLGLGRRLPRGSGERLLRRLAHLILSLPEAQLN